MKDSQKRFRHRSAAGIGPVFLLISAACASSTRIKPEPSPPAEDLRLEAPLAIRVGVTSAEEGPLTEALVRRLRAANLFAQVIHPLESFSEMDAALEFRFERKLQSKANPFEFLSMGKSGTNRFEETVEGTLVIKVGTKTVQEFRARTSVEIELALPGPLQRATREEAETAAGSVLAAKLVEPMVRDSSALAAGIQAAAESVDRKDP